jgi:hypothetical protein
VIKPSVSVLAVGGRVSPAPAEPDAVLQAASPVISSATAAIAILVLLVLMNAFLRYQSIYGKAHGSPCRRLRGRLRVRQRFAGGG